MARLAKAAELLLAGMGTHARLGPYGRRRSTAQRTRSRTALACRRSRIVKKLMQPRACSISGVRRAAHDMGMTLCAPGLGGPSDRGGHSLSPDDCARDDNVPGMH